MEDRFKFRYWDEENKRMDYRVYVSQEAFISSKTKNPLKLLDDDYTAYNPEYSYKNLMQCTGLKDCKGKLIYEGDYLNDKEYPDIKEKVFFDNKYKEMRVDSAGGEYSIWRYLDNLDDVSICGNIYENKIEE